MPSNGLDKEPRTKLKPVFGTYEISKSYTKEHCETRVSKVCGISNPCPTIQQGKQDRKLILLQTT
jgi:hypothetical protein